MKVPGRHGVAGVSTTLENILEFLADLFYKDFKFRTLGVYRSAISSNHEAVDDFKPHGVLFKVPGLTKCAGPKRPLQNLFLASFPPDRRLCFLNYLKQYEKVAKNL